MPINNIIFDFAMSRRSFWCADVLCSTMPWSQACAIFQPRPTEFFTTHHDITLAPRIISSIASNTSVKPHRQSLPHMPRTCNINEDKVKHAVATLMRAPGLVAHVGCRCRQFSADNVVSADMSATCRLADITCRPF